MKQRANRARVLTPTPRNLARAANVLRAGELVAVPSETVYGLAANALDARACAKIFRAKGRPTTDPLIVHIHALAQLELLAVGNDAALRLARAFWPGPLTMVLPKRACVPDLVSAGLPSVAVRMPAHPVFRQLLKLTELPLAAPSANPFGYVSPTTAEHVRANLGGRIGFIVDGGPCAVGLESTIVDLRNPARPRLLRPGAVTRAGLETVLGVAVRVAPKQKTADDAAPQLAPGRLTRHYSPRTPLVLYERIRVEDMARQDANAMKTRSPAREAWVFLAKPAGRPRRNVFWLDARGDLRGVARRLFALLQTLDKAGFARIHAECPRGEDGLAVAIRDRMGRAAAREERTAADPVAES